MLKRLVTCAASVSVFVVGCESDKSITEPKPSTALVRFINATQKDTIDVATGGNVATANAGLAFGTSTGCLTVAATSPQISFRTKGTTTDLSGFTPAFTAGHEYWVVAMTGATGTPSFVTIDQAFTPTAPATDNGIAALNAIAGSTNYDLHVTTPGTTLSSSTVTRGGLAFGVPSAFVNNTIPFNTATPPVAQPQQLQFTTAGTTTVARNHGNVTMAPGTSTLAIIAPGTAAAPTTLRSIFNAGC